jgi:hypothetical protein
LDPIKILVFCAAFALLIFLGRLLSASAEVQAHELPHDGASTTSKAAIVADDQQEPGEILTGAEVGLPFTLPPVRQDEKGRFNRPYYANYYFAKTDLIRGPADPNSFCDELFLIAQDPGSEHTWEAKYVVVTPSGLQGLMNDEQFASVYFDDPVVIVGRWDLALILRTVIEEDLKRYGSSAEQETPGLSERPRYS